jgi:hypothetical protein
MHVLQWIAVEAESKDDAVIQVHEFLNTEPGTWYDWFIVGGGRWNPEADDYKPSSNMVLGLEEDGLTAIHDKIDYCMSFRKKEFDRYRSEVDALVPTVSEYLDKYDPYEIDYSFTLYPLKKTIDMLHGVWDSNSYFFDMVAMSASPRWLRNKLNGTDTEDAGSIFESLYLVPVDFHF